LSFYLVTTRAVTEFVAGFEIFLGCFLGFCPLHRSKFVQVEELTFTFLLVCAACFVVDVFLSVVGSRLFRILTGTRKTIIRSDARKIDLTRNAIREVRSAVTTTRVRARIGRSGRRGRRGRRTPAAGSVGRSKRRLGGVALGFFLSIVLFLCLGAFGQNLLVGAGIFFALSLGKSIFAGKLCGFFATLGIGKRRKTFLFKSMFGVAPSKTIERIKCEAEDERVGERVDIAIAWAARGRVVGLKEGVRVYHGPGSMRAAPGMVVVQSEPRRTRGAGKDVGVVVGPEVEALSFKSCDVELCDAGCVDDG
jgi:hypothetical protein